MSRYSDEYVQTLRDLRATAERERDEARAELAKVREYARLCDTTDLVEECTALGEDYHKVCDELHALRRAVEACTGEMGCQAYKLISAAADAPKCDCGALAGSKCPRCVCSADAPEPKYLCQHKGDCSMVDDVCPHCPRAATGLSVQGTRGSEAAGAKPLKIWYMRDNHTFRALPLHVEAALDAVREEWNDGYTYGMLCSGSRIKPNVHGRGDWATFVAEARPWLERAVLQQKPAQPEEPK